MRLTVISLFIVGLLAIMTAMLAQGLELPSVLDETPVVRPQPPVTENPATPSPEPVTPVPSTPVPTPEPVTPTPEPTAPTPEPVTPTPEPITPTPVPEPTPPPATGGPHLDPRWVDAIKTLDGATVGRVTADVLNIRSAPSLDAPLVGSTYARHPVTIYDLVEGEPVEGLNVWYRIGSDRYVAAVYVEPFIAPAPVASYEGHWVDINLSEYYVIAYNGGTPVYAAITVIGRPDSDTPTGEFTIIHRVANETMDSATVGIPPGHPNYYYLENVKHTQYFTNQGHALHANYWRNPANFGMRGSNGCVNLLEEDAAWFWDFVSYGSVVSIHY